MAPLVWYASYGSNLLRRRFLTYLQGGTTPGAARAQVGCRDAAPPRRDRGILILHRLFFAGSSPQWENAGVAFLGREKEDRAKTLGRMYLITRDQFRDVFLQENGFRDLSTNLGPDLEKAVEEGAWEMPGFRYGALLHLGEEGEHPIFTFTAAPKPEEATPRPPGPRYLQVIAQGLRETFGLSDEGIRDYLRDVPGIRGEISEGELARIVAEAKGSA